MENIFSGVYRDGDTLYTVNANPGQQVYDERLVQDDGKEFRRWDPHRSKAAAALTKNLATWPVQRNDDVLYLGASTGTTVSHIADIVNNGFVYAVEYAPKIVRDLLSLSEDRDNIAPILGDARKPYEYLSQCSRVDVIYQDVAQQDQVAILRRNADMYLAEDGYAVLAIKAQSISSTASPEQVFAQAKEQLRDDFEIVAGKKLAPFHTDHLFLVLQPH